MDVESLIIQPVADAGHEFNLVLGGVLSWVLGAFVIALPIFLLVSIVTFVGRRWFAPWACYAMWSLVLIRLVLPGSVISPISVQHVWTLSKFTKSDAGRLLPGWLLSVGGMPTTEFSPADLTDDSPVPSPSSLLISQLHSSLIASIEVLILAGTIFVAGASSIAFARFVGWARYSRECSDPFCIEQADSARRSLGIGTRVRLRTIHEIQCPATFDWFWPTILLPDNIASMSETERTQIVWHEMSRLRRGDSGTSLFFTVVQVLHWWNPLFWWAGHCWKSDRELACDALMIQRLGNEHAAEFVSTLKQLDRTSQKRSRLTVDPPGFISLLDSESIFRRRIQALSQPKGSEGRLKYWFSWSVVAIMAVTGLTDAPRMPAKDSPIELPAGTTWHNSSLEEISEVTETRTYDFKECLAKWHPTGAVFPIEVTATQLLQRLNYLLNPAIWTEPPTQGLYVKLTDPDDSRCNLVGDDLIVRATPTQHEWVARLIKQWSSDSDQQLTLEFRAISIGMRFRQLTHGTGGKVFNSRSIGHRFESSLARRMDAPTGVNVNQAVHSPLPVFVRTLTSLEATHVVNRAQGDQRSNFLFSPKVTLFDGTAATVSDGASRPFVTGFRTSEKDSNPVAEVNASPQLMPPNWPRGPIGLDPVVAMVQEGIQVHQFALIESGKVRLRVCCRIASIVDVSARKLQMESEEFSIQVPQIRESFIESTSIVESGETLMLAPLERDAQGNLTILLITPRIIDMNQ